MAVNISWLMAGCIGDFQGFPPPKKNAPNPYEDVYPPIFDWLVVFSIYWEFHLTQLTFMFFRGVAQPPTSWYVWELFSIMAFPEAVALRKNWRQTSSFTISAFLGFASWSSVIISNPNLWVWSCTYTILWYTVHKILVGGLEHVFFSHILGIILPID